MSQTIGPARYQSWRATWLGRTTELLEHGLLLELAAPFAGLDVLDLGCGDASLSAKLINGGARVTGLDADPLMIAAAKAAYPLMDFRQGDACHLSFADASFDLVIANTLLCLTKDRTQVLSEAARVLKPNGRFVIGEIGRFSLWAAIRRIKGWLGPNLWRVSRFSSAASLGKELTQAGFAIETTRGAIFYPPWAWAARLLAPQDFRLGRLTSFGAAYIAIAARKRYDNRR